MSKSQEPVIDHGYLKCDTKGIGQSSEHNHRASATIDPQHDHRRWKEPRSDLPAYFHKHKLAQLAKFKKEGLLI